MIRLGAPIKRPRFHWPTQHLDRVIYLIKTKTLNHYYVGQTTMFKIRMLQHLGKKVGMYKGALFTQKHGVASFSILCETSSQREANRREEFYFTHFQMKTQVG
jgi:predicted GIY-YIG superfamily endonuclease